MVLGVLQQAVKVKGISGASLGDTECCRVDGEASLHLDSFAAVKVTPCLVVVEKERQWHVCVTYLLQE
jgi:hypothetical protein